MLCVGLVTPRTTTPSPARIGTMSVPIHEVSLSLGRCVLSVMGVISGVVCHVCYIVCQSICVWSVSGPQISLLLGCSRIQHRAHVATDCTKIFSGCLFTIGIVEIP